MRQSLIIWLFINYATHNSPINIHFRGVGEEYVCEFKVKGRRRRFCLLGQSLNLWFEMTKNIRTLVHSVYSGAEEWVFTRKSRRWRQHNRFICCILRPTICSYWGACFCPHPECESPFGENRYESIENPSVHNVKWYSLELPGRGPEGVENKKNPFSFSCETHHSANDERKLDGRKICAKVSSCFQHDGGMGGNSCIEFFPLWSNTQSERTWNYFVVAIAFWTEGPEKDAIIMHNSNFPGKPFVSELFASKKWL